MEYEIPKMEILCVERVDTLSASGNGDIGESNTDGTDTEDKWGN